MDALKSSAMVKEASDDHSLTRAQKAAIVLSALPSEQAGLIIEKISEQHLRAIMRAMAHIAKVSSDCIRRIIQEFVDAVNEDDGSLSGGTEQAKSLIGRFVTADTLNRLMDDVEELNGRSIWERIEESDIDDLSVYLSEIHPQAACIILTKINPEKASLVLDRLSNEQSIELARRMSKAIQVDKEVLTIIADHIQTDFLQPLKSKNLKRDPSDVIAGIINGLSANKRENIIEYLLENRPEVGEKVKKSILSFSDIQERVPASAIALIIRELQQDTVLIALRYGMQNAPSVVEFIFENISKRMVSQYQESIEKLPPIKLKEAEAAQLEFTSTIRRLCDEGKMSLIEVNNHTEEDYL